MNVATSFGYTPKRKPEIAIRTTSRAVAPSDMRIPNSRVRRGTAWLTTPVDSNRCQRQREVLVHGLGLDDRHVRIQVP